MPTIEPCVIEEIERAQRRRQQQSERPTVQLPLEPDRWPSEEELRHADKSKDVNKRGIAEVDFTV